MRNIHKICPFSPLTIVREYCTVVLDDLLDKTPTIEGRALSPVLVTSRKEKFLCNGFLLPTDSDYAHSRPDARRPFITRYERLRSNSLIHCELFPHIGVPGVVLYYL